MSMWKRQKGDDPTVIEEGGSGIPQELEDQIASGDAIAIEWKFGAPNTTVGNRYMALMEEFEEFNNAPTHDAGYIELIHGVPSDFIRQVCRNIDKATDPNKISIAIQMGIFIGQRRVDVPTESLKS